MHRILILMMAIKFRLDGLSSSADGKERESGMLVVMRSTLWLLLIMATQVVKKF